MLGQRQPSPVHLVSFPDIPVGLWVREGARLGVLCVHVPGQGAEKHHHPLPDTVVHLLIGRAAVLQVRLELRQHLLCMTRAVLIYQGHACEGTASKIMVKIFNSEPSAKCE